MNTSIFTSQADAAVTVEDVMERPYEIRDRLWAGEPLVLSDAGVILARLEPVERYSDLICGES